MVHKVIACLQQTITRDFDFIDVQVKQFFHFWETFQEIVADLSDTDIQELEVIQDLRVEVLEKIRENRVARIFIDILIHKAR